MHTCINVACLLPITMIIFNKSRFENTRIFRIYALVPNGFYFVFVDLGVVTPAQIQFFLNKTVETTSAVRLKNMVAIAYDPIKKDIYISDTIQKVGSIFRIKTTGDTAYSVIEPIVASTSELWPADECVSIL